MRLTIRRNHWISADGGDLKGYLVNWESEKEIWDRAFLDKGSKLKVTGLTTIGFRSLRVSESAR